MSNGDWPAKAYPGGPMVKVKGFPRPLYPPDASKYGKRSSAPGPDVEAYKRTVSRAGRWPWQTFDRSYSNAFAHGKGSNVVNSGVAGVQRQQKIDATGWIGLATFQTLRSIRIPAGLPGAGGMAMDAKAAALIDEAWTIYGGSEPAPPATSRTVRVAALERAITQLGQKESPAHSNRQRFGEWYGMNGQPWCAMFTTWAYVLGAGDVGKTASAMVRGSRYAYVPYLLGDARANRYGLSTTGDPLPGDLVCFDWNLDGVPDHVGIFEAWTTGMSSFSAIEGNTSTTNNSNGGEVMRRSRSTSGVAFVRVREP
jgi:CHAP domain